MNILLFIGIGIINDYPIHHHPLEYADFEGEMPQGQYGAGTVTIWDRGGLVVEDFRENEKILFELSGNKMQGRYALIKITPRPDCISEIR